MSNFLCPQCGKFIMDSPQGYLTGCEHYKRFSKGPVKDSGKKEIEDLMKMFNIKK